MNLDHPPWQSPAKREREARLGWEGAVGGTPQLSNTQALEGCWWGASGCGVGWLEQPVTREGEVGTEGAGGKEGAES